MTEDEIVKRHHPLNGLNGHESGQTPGDSEEQGSLVCCSPWGHKESDTTEQLNNKINDARVIWNTGIHWFGHSLFSFNFFLGFYLEVTTDWNFPFEKHIHALQTVGHERGEASRLCYHRRYSIET